MRDRRNLLGLYAVGLAMFAVVILVIALNGAARPTEMQLRLRETVEDIHRDGLP